MKGDDVRAFIVGLLVLSPFLILFVYNANLFAVVVFTGIIAGGLAIFCWMLGKMILYG